MPRSVPMVQIVTDLASLPQGIRNHISQRMIERRISPEANRAYLMWRSSNPRAPFGEDWFKDFGSFILVGKGDKPLSVLKEGMRPHGRRLAKRRIMFKSALLQRTASDSEALYMALLDAIEPEDSDNIYSFNRKAVESISLKKLLFRAFESVSKSGVNITPEMLFKWVNSRKIIQNIAPGNKVLTIALATLFHCSIGDPLKYAFERAKEDSSKSGVL